jgi:hypothetical protein
MTEREKTPAAADNLPPMPAGTTTDNPGSPSKTGVYENPVGAPQSERLVGMYDRPERTGPSPLVLIVAALLVIALIVALVSFVF